MEWIASLDFEKIANAIIILLTGFLAAFGFRNRTAAVPASTVPTTSATVEVAGALVDGSSVRLLAGETAGQTIAITAETVAIRAQTEAIEDLTRAALEVRDELREVRGEMRARR